VHSHRRDSNTTDANRKNSVDNWGYELILQIYAGWGMSGKGLRKYGFRSQNSEVNVPHVEDTHFHDHRSGDRSEQ
jgi:hypothetical protein